MARTSIHLPDELMELILSKSPIKSVLRFKSVPNHGSPSSPTLGSSEIIASNARKRRIIKKNIITWGWGKRCTESGRTSRKVSLIALEEDGKHQIESKLDFDFETVSFCNGLFLLGSHCQENKSNVYMLWNPSLRKHTMILADAPRTAGTLPWEQHLYYDSITNDYKIVLAYKTWFTVYSCKEGTWDKRDFPSEAVLLIKSVYPSLYVSFVDGFFYTEAQHEIACVDSGDGKLHKLRLPDGVGSVMATVEVSGHLCLHSSTLHSRRLEMWVMEKKNGSFENCWRKLTCMVIEHERPLPIWTRALVWWRNDDGDDVFRVRMVVYEGLSKFCVTLTNTKTVFERSPVGKVVTSFEPMLSVYGESIHALFELTRLCLVVIFLFFFSSMNSC